MGLQERRSAAVPRGVALAHPIAVERGSGAFLWDTEGKRYYDFVGGIGVLNAGHAHPAIVSAIADQAQRLTHACFQVTTYEPYLLVAERLNALAPGPSQKKALLLSTGAEATENAIKIARAYTNRPAVIGFSGGYHGRTLLALSMTGKGAPYKQNFGPYCSEIYHVPFPYEQHGWTTERALRALRELFENERSPESVAAIIVEPVLGEGGFVPAPPAFMHALREITAQHGIVLVCDEVQTGFGRTGRLFACEHYGIEPDLLTVAKSIAGGLPLSAVVGKAEIMDAPLPGGLGGTFAGNPVACAAALATFEIMDDAFLARARGIGARIERSLRELAARVPEIVEVRALGAMVAAEFRVNAGGSSIAPAVVDAARERGVLLLLAGARTVVRVLVPLVLTDEDLEDALRIIGESVESVTQPLALVNLPG